MGVMTKSGHPETLSEIRYPRPLRPGDVIGITAPSSGVAERLAPRLHFCVHWLEQLGYQVVVGECLFGGGVTSAPASARADELTAMLIDQRIRAVVPPWGGELAIDLLPLLDFDVIAAAEPTWFVGYSDISTLLTPLTMLTGIATLHSPNLMDTPLRVPDGHRHWLDFATSAAGVVLVQTGVSAHAERWPDIAGDPEVREFELTGSRSWKVLGDRASVGASGRLIGGCLETMSMLTGTAFGDVPAFASRYADEGTIVYLEAAEVSAVVAARMLHNLRLAGWFDNANAVLLGRTNSPADASFSFVDAVWDALGLLSIPVLYDVDFGHVPPQLVLVNGALAEVSFDGTTGILTQHLA